MVPAPQDTQSGAWEGRLAPLVGGRGAWLRPESWHHLFRETVQVLELDRKRRDQQVEWTRALVRDRLLARLEQPGVRESVRAAEAAVRAGDLTPDQAATRILTALDGT